MFFSKKDRFFLIKKITYTIREMFFLITTSSKKGMSSSIKAQIIIFYLAILFVILSSLGLILYISLNNIIYNSVDSGLLSRAKALSALISNENNKTKLIFSDEIMREYDSVKAKNFFEIRRFDGSIIEKSKSLKNHELPFLSTRKQISYHTVDLKKRTVRLVNLRFMDHRDKVNKGAGHGKVPVVQKGGAGFIIQCALDTDNLEDIMDNYQAILIIFIFSIMLISAAGGFFIAKKALSPIKEISDTIKGISESNLSERINYKDAPKELQELAVSFNHTFERLEKSFKRQKQLVGDTSHELRTPLSVILSQSEIMLRKKRNNEEYKTALMAIRDAAEIMSEIVGKLLALARLSNKETRLKMEPVNLNEVISQAVKNVGTVAMLKDITINLQVLAHGKPVISGHRSSLSELFINILENAVKYNVSKGKINIAVDKIDRKDKFFIIKIQDTGIGIGSKDIDKVFDRFYRADTSRSKKVGGIGLGLNICKEIVRLHGGRIEIKSTPGVGTIVSIRFEAHLHAGSDENVI